MISNERFGKENVWVYLQYNVGRVSQFSRTKWLCIYSTCIEISRENFYGLLNIHKNCKCFSPSKPLLFIIHTYKPCKYYKIYKGKGIDISCKSMWTELKDD